MSPHGAITGFVFGPGNTEGRWLVETLFRWRCDPTAPPPTAEELRPVLGPHHRNDRRGPPGPLHGRLAAGHIQTPYYLGDGGLGGQYWHQHWRMAYGVHVVTTHDPGVTPNLHTCYAAFRQVVETVHSCLGGTFGPAFSGARSLWGLIARLAAEVAAHNVEVLINALVGRLLLSPFNPFYVH